ncbi:MAG: carotenoid 1,2-hydratase [Armatimonadetes bacterium]|nr:carotenoid 1,2-hydratase [Armatimonadota bacterium]
MMRLTILLIVVVLAIAWPRPPPSPSVSVVGALSAESEGFLRATRPRPFVFPEDAGPHPGFQTEWWYYTGNLRADDGRRYGYQLTFFRRALTAAPARRKSPLAAHEVYFAHLALSDIPGRRFHAFERWSRAAAGLAGARSDAVWLDTWSARAYGDRIRLYAAEGEFALDLLLTPQKRPTPQGQQGLSRKSEGNASHYYSISRLATEGTVTLDGNRIKVHGRSWLDREWSSSALSREVSGWDWFSLQLSDGRDLMLYVLRRKDGGADRFSSGTVIDFEGNPTPLSSADFSVQPLDWWTSPRTRVRYPGRWRVRVPGHGVDLLVTPRQPDQELPLTFTYWEGAVSATGGGLEGEGYAELTGY